MKNPWFRLYTDFIDDPKIVSLAFEDQRHFVGLLCLKSAGLLDSGASPAMQDRIVAQRLWIDFALVLDVKKRLSDAGLIDQNWQPTAWNKRQFISDHDISGAERQRRHREKQRNALCNVTDNGGVTLPDTDTDTDTEVNISRKTAGAVIPPCPIQEVIDAYHEVLPSLPSLRVRNPTRDSHIKARWRQFYEAGDFKDKDGGLECFRWFFGTVKASKFLTGQTQPKNGSKPFLASLDWLMNANNFAKVIEGKYS